MSQFPNELDSDIDLPRVDDNITEIGADAINAQRAAIFNIESNIGIGAAGTLESIAARLSVSINPDGTISPSIFIGLLSLLNITDAQVSPTAAIQESKLSLTYSTASLYNLYATLKASVDVLNGFLSLTGVKLEPHIDGTDYNHFLSAILVDPLPAIVKTAPGALPSAGTNVVNRNTTNADTLIVDMNTDLVVHEKSDGTASVTATAGGTVPPLNYAHMASGVYVDSNAFETIPQTNNDVQKVFEYIDSSSLFLLGSRVQNFYANGISRTSRSSSFLADGYGSPIVPPTLVTAYFLGIPPGPASSGPVDSFLNGDDVILFNPSSTQLSTFNFDAQFSQVSPGDLLTINYGTGISYQFTVDSTKKIVNVATPAVTTYAVRINGKNPVATDGYAIARIDNATFNRNKYGVLAVSRAPNTIGSYESLIVTNPRSAAALGNGFNSSEFDSTHFNLYLTLLPNGDTSNIFALPAIDVTGNQGSTPGAYTLDSIVNSINTAFRKPGFNYRFVAFEYNGQIGISLADPYNNTSFSIVSGTVDGYGNYTSSSNTSFPNNVVDNFNLVDPMGFGVLGSNIASPPVGISYANIGAAFFAPTLLFYPLKKNFFYTDGVERDQLKSDPIILDGIQDQFGDGYWPATITAVNVMPSRVQVVYQANFDLASSGLAIGKTLVVQPTVSTTSLSNDVNYGRFIIENVAFNNPCTPSTSFTTITVYDAVHGTGTSPYVTLPVGSAVNLYFCDDSVSFDAENVFDPITSGPYKRFFEIYVDGNGHTTTHERARFLTTGSGVSLINFYNVSPKLLGYTATINTATGKAIVLSIVSYNQTTGLFTGQLNSPDSTLPGPLTTGKKGEIVRFYDHTNIDYIDFTFDIDATIATFAGQTLTIQLFPSLELDEQIMLLASCQIDDTSKAVSYLEDRREFGNVSEEQFTNSALRYISAPQRLIGDNGVINGFDGYGNTTTTFSIDGGTALINGNIVMINPTTIEIPAVVETLYPAFTTNVNTINWFVCANDKGEIELIASTDYLVSQSGTYGSLTQDRLFYVKNSFLSSINYPVRGTYLSNMISNFRDVVPLYIVTATGALSTASVISSTTDLRRFINNGNAGLKGSYVLGEDGNFRSMQAVNGWVSQLTSYISAAAVQDNGVNVEVRGTTINTPVTLNYTNNVIFNGNNSSITVTAPITLGSNVHFRDCVFNIEIATGFNLGTNNSFRNCTFNYIYDPVVFSDGGYSAADLINTGKGLMHMGVTFGGGNISIKENFFVWYPSVTGVNGAPSTSTAVNRYSFINVEVSAPATNAPPVVLQNVDISDNTFSDTILSSFTLPNAESVRAVVSFVSLSTVANAAGGGLKLVNIKIDHNICDKDQMIAITPISTTLVSNILNSALNVTNCKITNNTCGAISAFTQYDIPIDVDFTTNYFDFNADKNNGLTIDGNTCKYITATDARGVDISESFPTINFNTGPMNVLNNTCSWIKLVPNVWATAPGVLPVNIRGNTLLAYDTNFKKNYLNGTTTSLTNAAIELSLIGSSLSSIVLIDGNNANAGAYDTISPPVTAFSYDFGIFSDHDINATNNTFLNLNATLGAPNSTIGINLGSSSVNVHSDICHNIFYRFGAIWQAYVSLGFAGQHTVAFNFFDQITPDNTSTENQVTGTIGLSNIHDNKNQVINTPISLADGQVYYASLGGPASSSTGPAQGTSTIFADDVFTFNAITLAGTFHVINGNNVVNTTSDQTAVLSVGDVVAFTIQAFSYYQITAVSSSTITLEVNYFGTTSTATTAAKNGPFLSNPNPGNVQIFKYSQSTAFGPGVQYTGIVEFTLGQSQNYRNISFTIPLSNSLPPGVKILRVQMGVWYATQGASSLNTGVNTNNAITLILNQSTDSLFTTSGKVITDVAGNIFPTFGGFANTGTDYSSPAGQYYTVLIAASPSSGSNYSVVTPATASGGTQFLTITPTPGQYTTGSNKKIFAQVDMNFLRTGGTTITDQIYFYLSPILVSYTW